jgi:phosphoribosyl-dephospho-CoA transferase
LRGREACTSLRPDSRVGKVDPGDGATGVFVDMRVRVHDLLRVGDFNDLVHDGPCPRWLKDALTSAPWVVVRRAPAIGDLVPVGVRGSRRAERFAAFLPIPLIIERIAPEDLKSLQEAAATAVPNQMPCLSALSRLETLLRRLEVVWGPVGSVGFELATGTHVVRTTSDLDVIVRQTDLVVSPEILNGLLAILPTTEVALDILVETDAGGFSLLDYAKEGETLVVRTQNGPRQILHPMNRIPTGSCTASPVSI